MAPKKKKPGSSIQPKTCLSTPIQPSSNISVFFPLSSSSFQKDCELMDVWLHTQSFPEKLLQCWKNIKNYSLSEFQFSSTQLSYLDLTSKIFKELENINKRLDKQEAKPSYAQAAQKAIPSQIPLTPRTLREVLVHPGNLSGCSVVQVGYSCIEPKRLLYFGKCRDIPYSQYIGAAARNLLNQPTLTKRPVAN